jgi:hypothetical protein
MNDTNKCPTCGGDVLWLVSCGYGQSYACSRCRNSGMAIMKVLESENMRVAAMLRIRELEALKK